MANQEQQKSNSTPFILIGLVLLAAIIGGWWLYSSSKANPNPGNDGRTTTPVANVQQTDNNQSASDIYEKAPPGAQPPHTLGSPTATVTVEEFADFQCPTCGVVHGLMKQINSLYTNRIRFIFRNFPLAQIHANAINAASAAEAAGMQGKFWDMQNMIFTNQREWSNDPNAKAIFEKYAETIGLDVEKFKADYGAIPTRSRINNDMQRGKYLRVDSTPTIFINGKPVPYQQMSLQGLSAIIDAELKAAQNKDQSNSQESNTQTANSQSNEAKKSDTKEATNEAKPETEK